MSLRTATSDNVVIIDQTDGKHHVIGEVDRFGAPVILYEQSIYLHESKQVKVEYYTMAGVSVRIRVLDEFERKEASAARGFDRAHGEVLVSEIATIYKKLTLYTNENVGWGKIHIPEQELQ